jgi:molecular chaperone GrpE
MTEQTSGARETPETDEAKAPQAEAAAEAPFESQADAAEAEAEAADAMALRLAELEAERDELKKRLMYALADTENIRKRAERDRKDAEMFGGTRLARDLLSVHDNLTRALDSADESLRADAAAFFEGLELTRRELLNAFAKHRIEAVTPAKGDRFDPNLHQSMFEAPVPGAEPGTVIEVMQAGFTIAGRLLRPALVGVAKEVPAAAAAEG